MKSNITSYDIIEMLREKHSSKKEAAIKMALFERQYRGGKYECEVLETTLNKFDLNFSYENHDEIGMPEKCVYSTGEITNN